MVTTGGVIVTSSCFTLSGFPQLPSMFRTLFFLPCLDFLSVFHHLFALVCEWLLAFVPSLFGEAFRFKVGPAPSMP